MEEQQNNFHDQKQGDIVVTICDDDPRHSNHDENSEQNANSDTFILSNESPSHTENNVPETNNEGENSDHQKLDDNLKRTNSSGSDEKQEDIIKKNNEGKFSINSVFL